MPYRPKLQCPTLDFLDEVERTFSVVWPESFRTFCRTHASLSLSDRYPTLRGKFICDVEELEKTNTVIGEGSWGDYERAITGKRHPKDGRRLYLDLLPFYVDKSVVFGFETTAPAGDKVVPRRGLPRVVVWAVHTIVHDYPTFDDWLSREGAASRSKKKVRR